MTLIVGDVVAEGTDNLELNDQQKTRLLSFGLEPDRPAGLPDGDEQRGDLLCDILRGPLPMKRPGHNGACADAGGFCRGLRTVAGAPLGELLQNAKTEIAVLRRIKEYAKTRGKGAGSDVEKDVFLALYFAAIAAALVFHDKCVTEHRSRDLSVFLNAFAQARWVPLHISELLRRAVGRTRQADQISPGYQVKE